MMIDAKTRDTLMEFDSDGLAMAAEIIKLRKEVELEKQLRALSDGAFVKAQELNEDLTEELEEIKKYFYRGGKLLQRPSDYVNEEAPF